MYGDEEGLEWFHNLLLNDTHTLLSFDIGDYIGDIKVLAIYDGDKPVLHSLTKLSSN
jgi:hypothetical protein